MCHNETDSVSRCRFLFPFFCQEFLISSESFPCVSYRNGQRFSPIFVQEFLISSESFPVFHTETDSVSRLFLFRNF